MKTLKELIEERESRNEIHKEIEKEFDSALSFVDGLGVMINSQNDFAILWAIESLANELISRQDDDGTNKDLEHIVFNVVASLPFDLDDIYTAMSKLRAIDED